MHNSDRDADYLILQAQCQALVARCAALEQQVLALERSILRAPATSETTAPLSD